MQNKGTWVRNPLTIIAIFAGVAEVSSTIALPQLDGRYQGVFLGFVMGLPTLLVMLFFWTLHRNPRVLYAPADYREEKNFMESMQGLGRDRVLVGARVAEAQVVTASSSRGAELTGVAERSAPVENQVLALRFFSLRQYHLSDVEGNADARAIFQFGSSFAFNMFDGEPGVVFYGHFLDIQDREVLVRIRSLLGNIEKAYGRVEKMSDEQLAKEAQAILDGIRIDVLLPVDRNLEKLANATRSFKLQCRDVEVTFHNPETLRTAVEREYERLGV